MRQKLIPNIVAAFALAAGSTSFGEGPMTSGAIPIAVVNHRGPVNFEREVLPILRPHCLVCHNLTSAKAGLNLETPQSMIKGGDGGPVIKPRQGGKSLLVQAAAHQIESAMPPKDNKAAATDLTPEELGLIKLWIDQGAKGSVAAARVIDWQALPAGLNPIYAVALSADGQYAACGRANQIFVYHLPTGQLVTRLTDPALIKSGLYAQTGVAHRDLVESLAFSPDGSRLASGSYREVKLWRRSTNSAPSWNLKNLGPTPPIAAEISADGARLAAGGSDGRVRLWSFPSGKLAHTFDLAAGGATVLKFSPDGTRVAVAGNRGVKIWSVIDGKSLAHSAETNEFRLVSWLAGGRQLITSSPEGQVRLWSMPAAGGELVPERELKNPGGTITALATLSSPTNCIVTGNADGSIRLWSATTGEMIREIKQIGLVTALAARSDGQRLASAGSNGVVKLWDPAAGRLLAELKGNRYTNEFAAERERRAVLATNELVFRRAALKSAETNLTGLIERVKSATATNDAVAKEFETARRTWQDAGAAKFAANKADEEFVPVRNAIVAAEATDKASKEAAATAKAAQDKPDKAAAERFAAEATEKAMAAAEARTLADRLTAETKVRRKSAEDKLAAATKAETDAEKNFKKAESNRSQAEHELELASGAKTKADRTLDETKAALVTGETELKRAEEDWTAARQLVTAQEQPVRTLAFSADNRRLATAGEDCLIHTWSADDGRAVEVYRGHAGAVNAVGFNATNAMISFGADRTAQSWRPDLAWSLERGIGGDAASSLIDRVIALRFSPDGRILATGGGEPSRSGELKLWQAGTGKLVQTLTNIHTDTVLSLDFSRDGKWLASGGADRFARVTDLATGRVVKSFEGHAHHVLGVAWKADSRTLATAGADGVVKIWDFLTGERKRNIEGYGKEVTSIQFIGVTDQALTSAGDNRVRLIRDNGTELRSYAGCADFVYAAAATPDGSLVMAGGQDGVLRVWNGTNGQIVATFAPPGAR